MGTWLMQTGDAHAHLYPDDDQVEVAACGNELEDQCSHCLQRREVDTWHSQKRRCPKCEAAQVSGVAEKK